MDAILTLLFIALLVVGAVAATAALRVAGVAPFAAAAGVIASAIVVGASIVLSAFTAWTRGGMLGAVAVASAVAVVWWASTGRPRPPALRLPRRDRRNLGPTFVLCCVAGVTLLVQLYMGIRVAPNNWDSMTYHLSRAAYWLQEESITQFVGASIRQAASAPNGEVLQGVTMMVTGTDRWVESVQWLCLVGIALLVFSGARLLRFGAREAAFAAALFVVLPQPMMQASSTQNDLVVAFFVGAIAFFGVRGLLGRHAGDVVIAALALGLAIGTKGTAFIAGMTIALLLVAALVAARPGRRFVVASLVAALVAVISLGSFNYALNAKNRGSLFGGVQAQTALPAGADRVENAVQVLWSFADSPGFSPSWFSGPVGNGVRAVAGGLAPPDFAFAVDDTIQEDTSGFGLVGMLLLPAVLLVALLSRRAPMGRRVLAAAVILYVLAFALTITINPWVGRLLIPAVALAAPLFALLARRPAIAGATVVLACLSLLPGLLQNPQKQLVVPGEGENVFALDRRAQMVLIRPQVNDVFAAVDARVGPREALMFVGAEDEWDYPLFGPHRTRRVVRRDNKYSVTREELRAEGVVGALFAMVGRPPRELGGIPIAEGYWWVSSAAG